MNRSTRWDSFREEAPWLNLRLLPTCDFRKRLSLAQQGHTTAASSFNDARQGPKMPKARWSQRCPKHSRFIATPLRPSAYTCFERRVLTLLWGLEDGMALNNDATSNMHSFVSLSTGLTLLLVLTMKQRVQQFSSICLPALSFCMARSAVGFTQHPIHPQHPVRHDHRNQQMHIACNTGEAVPKLHTGR